MKRILLSVIAIAAPIALTAAEANVPATLTELGKTLRYARSLPVGSASQFNCPDSFEGMEGISKADMLAELGSPDMEESVHARSAEPFLLMYYDLRPPQSPSENGGSDAVAKNGYPTITFKLSFSFVVLSVSCNWSAPDNAFQRTLQDSRR